MIKISLKKGRITIVFYIFLIFSILFLFSGIYSAYSFANIILQKDRILSGNPTEVDFSYTLRNNSYFLALTVHIKNPGTMNFWITKISWLTFLMNNTNGTHKYQANDYSMYSKKGIYIAPNKDKSIKIVDNDTVKQWMSYVYPHIIWQKKNSGNTTWEIQLSIEGRVDNYQTEQYRFNFKTWYLWQLPGVDIHYDEIFHLN